MIEIESIGIMELSLTIYKGFTDDDFGSFLEFLESKGIFFGGSYNDNLVDGVLDISSADITLGSVETLINDFLKTLT